MRHLLTILAALFLCSAPIHAQTLKSLMFNSTNGNIAAATNVVWTNSFSFSTNAISAQVRTNLNLGWPALTNTNAATSLLGHTTNGQVVANTGTNVLTFTNTIQVASIFPTNEYGSYIQLNNATFYGDWECAGAWIFLNGFDFGSDAVAATSRTKLGIPLAALTNTSNVTMMRALSGSTNTNHPYSGSISVVGTNSTNTLVFSNGILQSVQ